MSHVVDFKTYPSRNAGPGAVRFPFTGCTGGGRNPAWALGPKAPWEEVDISFLVIVEHGVEEERKGG